jgi:hypothetical protein
VLTTIGYADGCGPYEVMRLLPSGRAKLGLYENQDCKQHGKKGGKQLPAEELEKW